MGVDWKVGNKGSEMQAKEYLKSISRLKGMIRAKRDQLAELHDQAEGLRAIDYSGVKVQTSPHDTMADTIAKLADLEMEYVNDIELYHRRLDHAIKLINEMPRDVDVLILSEHYIKGKNFVQIAYENGYSYDYVINRHGQALLEFGKMLKKD